MEINAELLDQMIYILRYSVFIGFTANTICEFIGYGIFKIWQICGRN